MRFSRNQIAGAVIVLIVLVCTALIRLIING